MESVPFTNLYGIVANQASPAKTAAPIHTDARAFESALAQARGDQETTPTKRAKSASNLMFSKMGAGVTIPVPHKVDSQRQVDTARTALYEQVLQTRGISHQMISQLAAGGGSQAFLNFRGVLSEGQLEARQAVLHRLH
ncbi:hypothetical protein DYH09_05580 [bacterium CPR1]|nr:hypothetical protein [bacterium CPR1]